MQALKQKPQLLLSRPSSVAEVAQLLNCNPRFIADEIRAGRLKAKRLSRKLIRIDPNDFQKWYDRENLTTK
jgi:excisionase family DNA binding protein